MNHLADSEDAEVDPDVVLRPNQKHIDRTEVEVGREGSEDVLDRNGHPTGERTFGPDARVTYTLRGIRQLRALEKRRVTERVQGEIERLQYALDSSRAEVARLSAALDKASSELRAVRRDQDEQRIESRIRDAVNRARADDQGLIQSLRTDAHRMTSEIDELRAAKRRLKAARQGKS